MRWLLLSGDPHCVDVGATLSKSQQLTGPACLVTLPGFSFRGARRKEIVPGIKDDPPSREVGQRSIKIAPHAALAPVDLRGLKDQTLLFLGFFFSFLPLSFDFPITISFARGCSSPSHMSQAAARHKADSRTASDWLRLPRISMAGSIKTTFFSGCPAP